MLTESPKVAFCVTSSVPSTLVFFRFVLPSTVRSFFTVALLSMVTSPLRVEVPVTSSEPVVVLPVIFALPRTPRSFITSA